MKTKKVKSTALMVREKKQHYPRRCDQVSNQRSRVFICSLGSFEQERGLQVPPESGRCSAMIMIQQRELSSFSAASGLMP